MKSKITTQSDRRLPSDTRLFRYTERDEARMICAMAEDI